ncbi:peptidoglycan bridge formation glycyltransferase FemA/FemB family protein [Microcoleus sp. T2B6]|uniref:peptidoglycan bridge formation glycyltransferase FemA/FemB family protein n=1 Tax=Microcoleus sp. T2B6 TaxID=3055424 RepID=UPI002FD047CA
MDTQIVNLSSSWWLSNLQKVRHDIYHLPGYVNLEAKRTEYSPEAILIVDDEKMFFLPYLVRPCDRVGEENILEVFDVVSPYGYPGMLLNEAATPEFLNLAINELTQVLRAKNVCSAFLRLHPLLNGALEQILNPNICQITGETVSIDLRISEAEMWQNTRRNQRQSITKCKQAGFTARMMPVQLYIDKFIEIYQITMQRVEAAEYYYSFNLEYFLNMADAFGEKMHLCLVELDNEIASGGLYTECCGIVQSIFSATQNKFLKQSPNSLQIDYTRLWAKERGNEVLHLGGGVGGEKDSLFHFKSGFSKQRHKYLTMRLIVDEEKYNYLVRLRAKYLNIEPQELLKLNFFPAYRSPK